MPRLVHVSANDRGYHRKGRGKGFEYLDDNGKRLIDKTELTRIKTLSIPPAWKIVWVCENPGGHLQAMPAALAEIETTSVKSLSKCLLKKVSEKLGNTVAVCRTYYVHPVILASAEQHHTDLDKLIEKAISKYEVLKSHLSNHELTTLYLIESH